VIVEPADVNGQVLDVIRRRRSVARAPWPIDSQDERYEVGCVDGAPAFLGGLDQLECNGDPGGLGAGPIGDLGPVLTVAKVNSMGLDLP
jgi:hypothetical protein